MFREIVEVRNKENRKKNTGIYMLLEARKTSLRRIRIRCSHTDTCCVLVVVSDDLECRSRHGVYVGMFFFGEIKRWEGRSGHIATILVVFGNIGGS